jgi:hypothetical protein
MRVLIILLLFAPALCAIETKDLDRDTLRYVRLALLKDEVRKHFELRIGDFESLDQAVGVNVKMGGAKELVVLRLKHKAAAVLIVKQKDVETAGAHCFLKVESRLEAQARLAGEFVELRCRVGESELPERTRLLRLKNDKLQCCLTWLNAESRSWEDGRYVKKTTRRFTCVGGKLQLKQQVRYLLDDKPVNGGHSGATTQLVDGSGGLTPGTRRGDGISVSTHCAIARKLERDGLNQAALHHASLAEEKADEDALPKNDTSRLEAMTLVARLEARLRRDDVVER